MLPRRGFEPQIGGLITLLQVSKARIIDHVSPLSRKQLDYSIDNKSPSIATLLKHMIALEYTTRIKCFEKRFLNSEELLFWDGSLAGQLLNRSVKGKSFKYYELLWEQVRNKTINSFKTQNDKWLYQVINYYENSNVFFMWYHLIEDHHCHLGQIKYMLRRLPHKSV
jgi:hypothetical protein